MEADISIWRKTGHFYFALTGARNDMSSLQPRSTPAAAQIVSCSPSRHDVVPVASSTIFIRQPRAPVPQTKHENCHPTAPSRQCGAVAHGASGGPSVSGRGSTIPPPAFSVAMFPRSLLPILFGPNVPLPVWVQTVLVLFRNTSSGSAAAPSVGISRASPDSNFCPHCDAGALWLLLHDSAAITSSPADSSPPASLLRLPASVSGPSLAPKPLLVEVPSHSSLSSSIGPPQEVVVYGG
jgi:hypothetical protein